MMWVCSGCVCLGVYIGRVAREGRLVEVDIDKSSKYISTSSQSRQPPRFLHSYPIPPKNARIRLLDSPTKPRQRFTPHIYSRQADSPACCCRGLYRSAHRRGAIRHTSVSIRFTSFPAKFPRGFRHSVSGLSLSWGWVCRPSLDCGLLGLF